MVRCRVLPLYRFSCFISARCRKTWSTCDVVGIAAQSRSSCSLGSSCMNHETWSSFQSSPEPSTREVPNMWRISHAIVAEVLLDFPQHQLVIEGLFVGRRDGSLRVQDALVLAESVGEFRAGLGWTGGLPELRPLASVWRKQVLGLKARTKKDRAEAYAVEWAPKLFDWSTCPWDAHDLTKAERGALAEAACMARWGVTARKYDGVLREALGDLEQA